MFFSSLKAFCVPKLSDVSSQPFWLHLFCYHWEPICAFRPLPPWSFSLLAFWGAPRSADFFFPRSHLTCFWCPFGGSPSTWAWCTLCLQRPKCHFAPSIWWFPVHCFWAPWHAQSCRSDFSSFRTTFTIGDAWYPFIFVWFFRATFVYFQRFVLSTIRPFTVAKDAFASIS